MKRPEETRSVLYRQQRGNMSGGKVLMEKIVLVSRERANHERLIALVKRLFPECTVEIVAETAGGFRCVGASVEKEAGAYRANPIAMGD
jgi:hypothetical protein